LFAGDPADRDNTELSRILTDDGLRISARMEVVDTQGEVIPRLYAAGSNGQSGMLLEGHGHHLGGLLCRGGWRGATLHWVRIRRQSRIPTPSGVDLCNNTR
jgi:hypothetical protein